MVNCWNPNVEVKYLPYVTSGALAMAISSEAPEGERSETIPQGSRPEARSKRHAPLWGEDIVPSSWKREAVQEAFDGKFTITKNCWEWTGGTSHGYGELRVRSVYGEKPLYAHRVAYVLFHGPIPDGLSVLHRCDNPLCVCPDHLFLGTQSDNHKDMVRKGRHPQGEGNGGSKLTVAKVVEMRELCDQGWAYYALAEKYGISGAQVTRIVRGQQWKDTGGPIQSTHGNFKHGGYCSE